ncbi:MAG: hypothetical protein LBU65_09690 [Planctomycetaceae bacterium]|jgi:hypothetical protein|nr:hypothetical protein [Planctomycetaceae bacterium]
MQNFCLGFCTVFTVLLFASANSLAQPLKPESPAKSVPSGVASAVDNVTTTGNNNAGIDTLDASEHPWGAFLPGSYTKVRTTTTTFQQDNTLRNTSETKTLLHSVGNDTIKLQYVRSIELGSKRFDATPQVTEFDFYQQQVTTGQTVKNLKNAFCTIGQVKIPCSVRQYEQNAADLKQTTTVWYSSSVYPFVLRIETVKKALSAESETDKIMSSTVTSVTETSALQPYRRHKQDTYTLRTVRKNGELTTTITTACSRHVPGGMTSSVSTENDTKGKVTSQTVASVVKYEAYQEDIEYAPIRGSRRQRWIPVTTPD